MLGFTGMLDCQEGVLYDTAKASGTDVRVQELGLPEDTQTPMLGFIETLNC